MLEVTTSPIFDFSHMLDYLARSELECVYEADADGVTRLVEIGGERRLIRVTSPSAGRLAVAVLAGAPLDDAARDELARYVRLWFDADRELEPFVRLAADSPVLGPVAERFRGLRVAGVPDVFEAIAWAILGQQVNLAFAYALKRRIVARYGESLEHDGRTYYAFPQPDRLLGASVEELCGLRLTRAKAAALLETARRIASGELSRDRLLALGNSVEAERELTRIKGVGPWTAQYVRMRCLLDASAFPIADVGLQNAVKHLLGLDRKPSESELRELFRPWHGWEAYATFYLWRTLY